MEYAYFVAIATMCVVLAMLALVRYVVQKIRPRSFRLTVALARLFSFSVEMESRSQDAKEVMPGPSGTSGNALRSHPPELCGDTGTKLPYGHEATPSVSVGDEMLTSVMTVTGGA